MMKDVCLACIGFILQTMIFLAAGRLVFQVLKLKEDISLQLILGYLAYFAVFEILFTPMTLLWVSLSTAAGIWAVIMAVAVLGAFLCIRRHRHMDGTLGQTVRVKAEAVWKQHSVMLLLLAAVIFLQCLIVIFYEDITVDAAYYVGTVSTSVYTNTLGRFDPFRGGILQNFHARYVLSAYPMNNAVWCRLFGIHPIVQAKIVMSCENVIIANLVIYQIGKRLFGKNRKKADLMVLFVCVLQLFCGTIYTAGTFFFTRSYEGKAILANIVFPVVLMCALWLYEEKEDRRVWAVLFITAVSALGFSGSAIILPAAVLAGMVPVMRMKRKLSGLPYCILCMVPSVLYAGVYFTCKLGLLSLAAS